MRGAVPLSFKGNCGAGEAFLSLVRSKCQVANLILKASLTYFMQYFASISAYSGAVAGTQSKKKGNDQELTKYLINDCGSFWIMRVCMLVYGLQTALSLAHSVPCSPPPSKKKKKKKKKKRK